MSQVAIVFTDGKVAEAPARAVRGGAGTGAGVRFREGAPFRVNTASCLP